MATPVNQKEYLKKYLGGGSDTEKKKKKKKKKDKGSSHSKGMRIIEDSVDIKTVPFGYNEDDDNPTIAEITYDDEKQKLMEEFEGNKKWKKVADKDKRGGEVSDWLEIGRHDSGSPPRGRRHDSESPPLRAKHGSRSPKRARHDSDSPSWKAGNGSPSPSRKVRRDSASPLQKKSRHSSPSPPRSKQGSESPPQRRGSASPPRRARHDTESPPGKMRSDSESPPRKLRHDSTSPPRKSKRESRAATPKKKRHRNDSDSLLEAKLVRKENVGSGQSSGKSSSSRDRAKYEADLSPMRGKERKSNLNLSLSPKLDSEHSPVRRRRPISASPKNQHRTESPDSDRKLLDSDNSPVRRSFDSDSSSTPPRRRQDSHSPLSKRKDKDPFQSKRKSDTQSTSLKQELESYCSPSVLKRHGSESSEASKDRLNTASFRAMQRRQDMNPSPPPPRRHRHDSDASPPRRESMNPSPPARHRHDSDTSPPRKQSMNPSPPRRRRHDSDVSPPRRHRNITEISPKRRQNDSDSSPPRKLSIDREASPFGGLRYDSDSSPVRRKRREADVSPMRRKIDIRNPSPPRSRREAAQSMLRQIEEEQKPRAERRMTAQEYLLARKKGKLKKDTPEDIARKEREAILQRQAEEKNLQWKHGMKQVQNYQQKMASEIHEMGKAFARSADDVDLNIQLKGVTRTDDPMLEYMMKKEAKVNRQPAKPIYKGSFPPNRLDIRPGYRWDGVDRSNGFEKRWFEHQNNKRAMNEDAYKWSVSDM